MKFKLACADFTFPLLPHRQALELIATIGFEGVDIGLFEGRSHLRPSQEFKQLGRSARRLKKQLDDVGLKAADVFLQTHADLGPFTVNHPLATHRRKARDWFVKTLEYTSLCAGRHVTILPGITFPDRESRPDSLARAIDELSWRVEQARQHKITIGVEAHIGSIVPQPKLAAKLVERVPGLTLTLDYTHFTRTGKADSEVEPLMRYASHFHVRGARRGRLQERFALNTIDYRRVAKAMQQTGYRGWVGIEYVRMDWQHCNECDNLSETILYRDLMRSLST